MTATPTAASSTPRSSSWTFPTDPLPRAGPVPQVGGDAAAQTARGAAALTGEHEVQQSGALLAPQDEATAVGVVPVAREALHPVHARERIR
jgi:hypothetical protein